MKEKSKEKLGRISFLLGNNKRGSFFLSLSYCPLSLPSPAFISLLVRIRKTRRRKRGEKGPKRKMESQEEEGGEINFLDREKGAKKRKERRSRNKSRNMRRPYYVPVLRFMWAEHLRKM